MPATKTTSKQKKSAAAAAADSMHLNSGLKSDELLRLYSYMVQMREFEDSILRLYQQGKIVGGAYSGHGNEATAVGSAFALTKDDYLFPMHRDMGAHIVKGQSVLNLMLQHLGRDTSLTRGRDGTGHYSDPKLKIYGNISHLGAMVPVACGAALASKMRNERAVAMTYIGDGGASIGEVHEALCMASVMKLPLILIIENNQFAYSTPTSKQFIVDKLSKRAIGYGIPGITVDGTDVMEVYRVAKEAVARGRKGDGPTIIESVTMRMHGHAAHDNAWYVPKQLFAEWRKKDPIARFETLLMSEGVLSSAKRDSMREGIVDELESAMKTALERPYPGGEEAAKGVFQE
ncbi:MAG TPA: thiamine pyrophosphate-dependent dehydrogenase E1 component subunit alpha [Bacteroidota bacterium]|jgi:pyruvate dehydrogenase E1 component alpha subunit|nr:thiamine pyrophosphate-dependent dehydrogenase E1 component subunit alpha [Bacteroidota bacterium]